MKVYILFKIIVKEFRKNIFISVFLFVLVDFLYANFTGVSLNRENGAILWQGGNAVYTLNLSTVLLKLLNISLVFITAGKIADKLSGDIMIYILARITNYRKFVVSYSAVVIMLGEILLTVSHIVYYCFAGFYLEQAPSNLLYLLMDGLGFFGIMILYMILNNCCSLENSFAYIIVIYLLNTVLPLPILPAMSTVRFLILKNQFTTVPLLLLTAGMDMIAAGIYLVLIRKKRVNIC